MIRRTAPGLAALGLLGVAGLDLYQILSGDRLPVASLARWAGIPALLLLAGLALYSTRRQSPSRPPPAEGSDELSANRYRPLFEHSQDAVFLTTSDGVIEAANPAAQQMLGLSEREIIKRGRAGIVETRDPSLARLLEERRLTGKATGTLRVRRADGSSLPVDVISARFTDNEGRELAFVVARDISERQRREAELAASEDRFRALYEHSPDAILLVDADTGENIAANPAAERLFGMSQDVLVGRVRMTKDDIGDPDFRRFIEERRKRWQARATLMLRRADGSQFPADVTSALFRDRDDRLCAITMVRDVTEQLERERRLAAGEAQMRSVFENSMDAIMLSDPEEGRLLACNRAAEELFGLSEAELRKRGRGEMIDMESPGIEAFLRERDAKGSARGVLRIRRADGTPVPVEATTSIFHDERGQRRSSVILRDISSRLRKEQQLRESEDRYRALFEQSADAIFITQPDGTINDCNPAAERLFGAGRDEIRELGRAGLVDESEAAFLELMEERKTSTSARGEIHMRRASGEWFLADISIVGFKNIRGEDRTSVVVRDITEQRHQQRLLLESEERFRSVYEHSPDAIFLVDPADGRTLAANPAAEELLGLSGDELVGRTRVQDTVSDDPAMDRFLAERKRTGRARSVLQIRRSDGTTFPAEVTSALFTDRKGRERASVMLRDMTSQLEYEAALKASEERFRIVADNTGQAIYEIDLSSGDMIWAGACEHMFGMRAEELARMSARERLGHVSEEDRERVADRYRQAARTGDDYRIEYRLDTADGRRIEVEDRGVSILETQRTYGVIQDVTDQNRLIRRLRDQKFELSKLSATQQAILDALPAHVALLDEDGRVRFLNASWQRFAGTNEYREREAALGGNYLEICDIAAEAGDRDAGEVAEAIRSIIAGSPRPFDRQYACHGPENEFWFRQIITPYRSGDSRGAVVAHVDVTDRVQAERQLELVAAAFRSADEALLICDSQFLIRDVNQAYERLIGMPREEAIGSRPTFLEIGNQRRAVMLGLEMEGQWHGELMQRAVDGRVFTSRASVIEVRGEEPEGRFLVANFEDISRLREIERRVDYLSYHDALTGLPNRAAAEQWFAEFPKSEGDHLAVAYVDLDGFKAINESFGHSSGDDLLMEVSDRIRKAARARDYVARLGGDDFIVMLSGVTRRSEAVDIVTKLLDSVAQPFESNGRKFYVSATAGICRYPEDGRTLEELLRRSDAAHAAAKQQGRGQIRFFTEGLHDEVEQRTRIESHLRDAIERDELELNYQPCVRLSDGSIRGLEALVRWHSPELGVVSPSRFVDVAERTGLINELGAWVLDRACEQRRKWIDAGLDFGTLSINLSPLQFQHPDLLDQLRNALSTYGIEGGHLRIEITENMLMLDPGRTIHLLNEFREMDIEIAVDDFGTGYSSMAYLRSFPLQYVKLDRAFVDRLPESKTDARIVRSVIQLAADLGMEVIAEGVETPAQRQCLLDWGCSEAQGFYFSRPLSSADAGELLKNGSTLPFD